MNTYNGGYSTDDIISQIRRTTASWGYTDYSESYSVPDPYLNRMKIKIGDVYFDRKRYKHYVVVGDFCGFTCKIANTMDKEDTEYATEQQLKNMELVL